MAPVNIPNSSIVFTYKWQIENYEFCHHEKNQVLESPEFIIGGALGGSKWRLNLYPRGNLTSNGYPFCHLSNCEGMELDVQYGVLIVVPNSVTSRKTKMIGQYRVYSFFQNYLNLPELSRSIKELLCRNYFGLLQSGALTIKCVILDSSTFGIARVIPLPTTKRSVFSKFCSGHTFIGTKFLKKSFKGVLHDDVYERVLVGHGKVSSLNLKMKLQRSDGSVVIQVHKIDRTLSAFSKCSVTFPDQDSKERTKTYEHYFLRDRTDFQTIEIYCNQFVGSSSSQNIKLDITFEISDGSVCASKENFPNELQSPRKGTEHADTFLLSTYIDKKFCDFTLVSSDGKEFKVHKAVLYSASSYFKVMLEDHTEESRLNLANLQNTDSQTLDLVLRHIYSAQLHQFHPETAMKVFAAADEYALLSLKNHCSILIATQISFSNFLDVLVLADMHSEWYLKMSVQNFVMNHVAEALASEEWPGFAASNARLASEVLAWVTVEFKEKLNI